MLDKKVLGIITDLQDAGVVDLGITQKQIRYLISKVSKLQPKYLNEKEVEKIIRISNAYEIIEQYFWELHSSHGLSKRGSNIKTTEAINKVMEPLITEICKLQPKNQVVIAEGEVIDYLGDMFVGKIFVEVELFNYLGKKGKLILEVE